MGNEAEPRNQLRNKNHELSGRSIDVKQNSDHDHDHEHLNITHNTENKNNTSTTSTTSSTKEKTGLLTKVLVVEDDKGLNLLIQKTLQKQTFRTDGAFTGADAIAKTKNSENMILLMDYLLPDMTGKQVIETLTKKRTVVPFIIMTGHGDENLAVEMMKLGAKDYLIKDKNLIKNLPLITNRVNKELAQETRLKLAEFALRESEEKYSTLVEQAMDGVVIVQDEIFKFANSAIVNQTGYSVDEIVGKTFLDLIAPEDKRLIEERKRFHMAGEKGPTFYEAKMMCKNKTIKNIELSVSSIKLHGKPARMGIIRDITERKHAEEALRESQEMYKTLVNTSPDAVIMTDLKGKITYISPRTIELHGYSSAEELLGKSAFKLIAPEDHEKAKNNLQKTINDGIIRNLDHIFIRKNQARFKGGLNAALIRDSKGKPKGMIATIRDITIQKEMEEDLKRYAKHLENEVKQRTNELIQSEKMAALGQLVAGVAHEVNNPLGYVKCNTDLIKMNLFKIKECFQENNLNLELLEKFEMQIDTNIKGINRIASIINTLKRFSKPDLDGMIFADINQGLKDTLMMAYNQLKHRIEVTEDYGKLPQIECNLGQLNQVFMNLILNASQAMETGKIRIKTWNDEEHIFVEIKDNGSGITNDKITKIFDPFFTTKDMGTGLGLSISYRIIKDHNGEILVDSNVNEGTKMTVKLPWR